ncbi:MAG: trypsin-like peptidase domain-containing protein [Acidobacteriota bacterium]|nr:trypsin-like peptidase domain-containing protein [Acidobacteriota bacterium]
MRQLIGVLMMCAVATPVTAQRAQDPAAATVLIRVEVVFRAQSSGTPSATFVASVLTTEPAIDPALLSIAANNVPFVSLGDSDAVTVGQPVRVLGFPFGGAIDTLLQTASPAGGPQISTSVGTLSAVRQRASDNVNARLSMDAVINPGNSGGPLVDANGYVVGVVQLEVNRGGQETRLGFALGVNHVVTMVQAMGLDRFLPVPRLTLGAMQAFEAEGLRARLPIGSELFVVAPAPPGGSLAPPGPDLALRVTRVPSSWAPQRLAQELVSTQTFETAGLRSTRQERGSGERVVGSATGVDANGEPIDAEYVVVALGDERLVARYVGAPDVVSFNRSILRRSLERI